MSKLLERNIVPVNVNNADAELLKNIARLPFVTESILRTLDEQAFNQGIGSFNMDPAQKLDDFWFELRTYEPIFHMLSSEYVNRMMAKFVKGVEQARHSSRGDEVFLGMTNGSLAATGVALLQISGASLLAILFPLITAASSAAGSVIKHGLDRNKLLGTHDALENLIDDIKKHVIQNTGEEGQAIRHDIYDRARRINDSIAEQRST